MTKRYRLAKDIETPNYYVYRGQELFRLNDDVLILKATDRFIRPDAIREIHFHEKHEIQKLLGDWFTEIKEEKVEVYPMYAESFQLKPIYILRTSELVHDKLGIIKSAIEDVLNKSSKPKEEEPMVVHLKLGMNFIGNINGCKTGFIVKAIETLPSSNLLVKIFASFSGDLIEFEILNEPKGLFFEYDGSKPNEVRFDGQDYILKSNSWSDNDMIEFAIWYFIDHGNLGHSDKQLLEVWKSKNKK